LALTGKASSSTKASGISAFGSVVASPKVLAMTFKDDPLQAQIDSFTAKMATSGYWSQTTSEYGVGPLVARPAYHSDKVGLLSGSDGAVETWLRDLLTSNAVGAPDPSTLYAVYLTRANTGSALSSASCGAYTGYHSELAVAGTRIGYAVRVRASGMHDVRTVPDNTGATMSMSASLVRLWALGSSDGSVGGGGIDTGSDGWTTYSLAGTAGGGINTHPFINRWRYGAPEFNRDILNVADFRPYHGHSCASVGVEVQVCMSPSGCGSSSTSWVALPERFCTIAPDTVGRTFWSDDPVLSPSLRHNSDGTPVVAERAVIWTDGSIDTPDCVPVAH
jgi:hypothetical protein